MTKPVVSWLGRRFTLRDDTVVEVVGVDMAANQRVNLTLRTPRGKLYLTTRELERNIAEPTP